MVLKNFSLIKAIQFGIMMPLKHPLLFIQSVVIWIVYFLTTLLALYIVGSSIWITGSLESIWRGVAFSITVNAPGYGGISVLLLSMLVCFYILAGSTHIILLLVKNKTASIKDMWIPLSRFGVYMLVFCAYGALVLTGTIFLVIPGLYFAYKYLFAPIISLDYGYSVTRSFEISRNITFGAKLKLFFSMFVLSLLNGLVIISLRFIVRKAVGIVIPDIMLLVLAIYILMLCYIAFIHIYYQLLMVDEKTSCDPSKDYCG